MKSVLKRNWKELETVLIVVFSVVTSGVAWGTEALYKKQSTPWITSLVIQYKWEIILSAALLLIAGLIAFVFFEKAIFYVRLVVVLLLVVVGFAFLLPLMK